MIGRTSSMRPDEIRPDLSGGPLIRRLLLVALFAGASFAAWRLFDIIVLAFGSALLALLLRGLARSLSRWSGIPEGWAVAPVVVALLLLLGAVGWLFGSQIAGQFDLLAQDVPQSLSQFINDSAATAWGAWFLDQMRDMNLTSATGQLASHIASLSGSLFRSAAYVVVLMFAAVYLAAQPDRYRYGLLQLVPPQRRERIGEVLELIGATLRRWLVGQSIAMAVVGTLTGLGLWILGVGAPLALGMIAGLFAFVPYVGPILASAPAILMAATGGLAPALYTAALYGAVHFVEGNLITPLVQAEVIELPPVVTMFAALVFGTLLGPVGVFLAAPLTVVLLVAVNTLYFEDALGERRTWPPTHAGGRRA